MSMSSSPRHERALELLLSLTIAGEVNSGVGFGSRQSVR